MADASVLSGKTIVITRCQPVHSQPQTGESRFAVGRPGEDVFAHRKPDQKRCIL